MSDCENVWLAIRVGGWVLGIAFACVSVFWAGYERGYRIALNDYDVEITKAIDRNR